MERSGKRVVVMRCHVINLFEKRQPYEEGWIRVLVLTDCASGPTTMTFPVDPSTLIELTPVSFSICLMRTPALPMTRPITLVGIVKSTIIPEAISPCALNKSDWVLANLASIDIILIRFLKCVSTSFLAFMAVSVLGAAITMPEHRPPASICRSM